MSGRLKADRGIVPSRAPAGRLANGAEGIYVYAGRGIGHYAIGRQADWVSHSAPPAGLHRLAKSAAIAGAVLALAAFMVGVGDAIATGDSPGLAQDRVFFFLQDMLVTGPHELAFSIFGSADAFGSFGALVSAAGFCIAALTAELVGLGANVATTAAHLVHLGGL
jgi:hypothetical protein